MCVCVRVCVCVCVCVFMCVCVNRVILQQQKTRKQMNKYFVYIVVVVEFPEYWRMRLMVMMMKSDGLCETKKK